MKRRVVFLKFCRALGKRSITEFNYRYADATGAHIYVGLGVASKEDRLGVVENLQSKGLSGLRYDR